MIISIDGPAASGKSTTAKLIAEELDLLYLDTGAMYRAVALYLKQNEIDYEDFLALESSLDKINISFEYKNGHHNIFLNGTDVSQAIRTPEITKLSSQIAVIKCIRKKMVETQRKLAKDQNVILDGRDIGTVVFPDADIKIFLTASLEARAKRRFTESQERGIKCDIEDIKQELIWRDQNDSTREEAPLKKPEGAIEVNTTNLTINEQTKLILKYIKSWCDR
jgi:cytidylate kinase